jgi:hypothetical protein
VSGEVIPMMLDAVFVAVTLAFFLVSWLYVRACERI